MDYPYCFLQEVFGCSSKTVTAAKVHSILFGRGGTLPSKFKFKRQWVSPEVLKELSEFFERPCVQAIILSECGHGRWGNACSILEGQCQGTCELVFTGIPQWCETHLHLYALPANFRYNTMLAGLCNIWDECGHSNFEKLFSLLTEVESATAVSMKQMKARVADYQRFCKTIIQTSREALTLCRTVHELCIWFLWRTPWQFLCRCHCSVWG